MSNLQVIAELCSICSLQNKVIKEMASALAQVGAEVMEEERIEAEWRFRALIGDDEGDACKEAEVRT